MLYNKVGKVTAGLGVHEGSLHTPNKAAYCLTATKRTRSFTLLYRYASAPCAFSSASVFQSSSVYTLPFGPALGFTMAAIQLGSEKVCHHICKQLVCNALLIKADIFRLH